MMIRRRHGNRHLQPFSAPPSALSGFLWHPLLTEQQIVPYVMPPGCTGESHVEGIYERPTDEQPMRLLVVISTNFYESDEHYCERLADARDTAARHRAAKKATVKRRASK